MVREAAAGTPMTSVMVAYNELHTLVGNQRAETGRERCALRSGRPLFNPVHDDAWLPAVRFEHPTSSRTLAVVEQHHGDFCGQCER